MFASRWNAVMLGVLLVVATAAAANDEVVSSPEIGAAERQAAAAFWTEERMNNARGHPALLSGGDPARIRGPPNPDVVQMLREAGLLDESFLNEPQRNRTTRQFVDRTGLPDGTSKIDTSTYWMQPFKSTGRVFGTDGIFGYDYACSGAIVGDGVIMTAGHCCGGNGVWNKNLVIKLEYQNGCGSSCTVVPFSQTFSPSGWMLSSLWQFDYCFAGIAGPKPGYSLGLAVLVSQARIYLACGYPSNTASSPGEYLYCTRNAQSSSGSGTKGIPSKLGEGASGGPWTIGTKIAPSTEGEADTNFVNGLNSHIYPGKLVMYSPNFDALTMQTYEAAAASG